MAFEIPNDLIKNVQALFRKESGSLSTYHLHDSSIHPLPSLDASISEVDKLLPDNPRCKKCNAKFLRGTQSLICIYCGSKIQVEDYLPDPISFNSSFACQRLLHSLDLDKSDSVGSCNGILEVNKEHRSPKHKFTLHGLLDLQISLSDDYEKPKTRITKKASDQCRSLNITGAYLGNIFSKSPSMVYKSGPDGPARGHSVISQIKTFVDEEKLASSSPVVGMSKNMSRQDENFDGSVDAKDGPSPGDLELQHSDVAECVGDNECQVNNASAPSDSTIGRHDNSLDN